MARDRIHAGYVEYFLQFHLPHKVLSSRTRSLRDQLTSCTAWGCGIESTHTREGGPNVNPFRLSSVTPSGTVIWVSHLGRGSSWRTCCGAV